MVIVIMFVEPLDNDAAEMSLSYHHYCYCYYYHYSIE